MTLGIRYMIGSALFYSMMSALVKVLGRHLPSHEIVIARVVVTLVLSYAVLKKRGISPLGVDRKVLVVRGVAGATGLYCYYTSLTTLPLADATVLQYLNPVFAAFLAVPFLGERATGREIGCAALGLVGTVLVAQPSFLSHVLGVTEGRPLPLVSIVIAVVGAMASAVAYVAIRRLRATDDPDVIVFYFPLVALPLCLPTLGLGFVMPTSFEWLLLLGVGVTTQVAQMLMTHGLHLERTGRATAASYTQVAFAYGFSILAFGETPRPLAMVGTALIVGATLVLAMRGQKSAA